MGLKNRFSPNCQVSESESTAGRTVLNCNVTKRVGDIPLVGERAAKLVVEEGRVYILDDGGNDSTAVSDLLNYVRNTIRPR